MIDFNFEKLILCFSADSTLIESKTGRAEFEAVTALCEIGLMSGDVLLAGFRS